MKNNIDRLLKTFLVFLLVVMALPGLASQGDEFGEDEFKGDEFSEGAGNGVLAGLSFTGFLQLEQGLNITGEGPLRGVPGGGTDWIMANRRFRLQASKMTDRGGMFVKLDFIRDEVTGRNELDIRELRLRYRLFSWLDVSLGRQVSTWGTGDMVFINDLFPKNWVANFAGRDMEDMKDSSTSLRMTSYFGGFTLDLVYHPRFTADTTPTGTYFSVFDPNTGQLVAGGGGIADKPAATENDEIALALKKKIGRLEFALYGYDGFYKNPRGLMFSGERLVSYYPGLSVWGASLEGQVGPGILTAEAGYYDSREDRDGVNPLVENAMFKYLVGYRFDLSARLMVGVQWYREIMRDHDAYLQSYRAVMGSTRYAKKQDHDTFTLRLMYRSRQETFQVGLFSYVRPQDRDSFTRLDMSKRLDNHFTVTAGVSVFTGEAGYEDREFGMQRHDDNIFLRLRYNF